MWEPGAWDDPTQIHWFPDKHGPRLPVVPELPGCGGVAGQAEPLPGCSVPPSFALPGSACGMCTELAAVTGRQLRNRSDTAANATA